MPVIRIEKIRNYTIMSNYHLQDPRISFKAKGLLSYMLTLPDCWEYSIAGLAKVSKDGVDAIRNILNELESFGYITRNRERKDDGTLGGIEYVVREKPEGEHFVYGYEVVNSENPMLGNPIQAEPRQDEPTQKSTIRKNHVSNNQRINNIPPNPPKGETGKTSSNVPSKEETGFSDGLQEAFEEWIEYKAELKFKYTKTSLSSLVKRLRKSAEQYGEQAVISMLQDTMSSGYKGPVWDWLTKNKPQRQETPQSKEEYENKWKEAIKIYGIQEF